MKHIESASAGVFITGVIFVAGAWLASNITQAAPEAAAGEQAAVPSATSEATSESGTTQIAAQEQAGLTVEIAGVRGDQGRVILMVFDDAKAYKDYDYERAVGYREIKPNSGTLFAKFPDLKQGPYAVVLFHDENEDYEFNTFFGYPREGYGTSNATNYTQTLSFEEALVDTGGTTVQLFYLE